MEIKRLAGGSAARFSVMTENYYGVIFVGGGPTDVELSPWDEEVWKEVAPLLSWDVDTQEWVVAGS